MISAELLDERDAGLGRADSLFKRQIRQRPESVDRAVGFDLDEAFECSYIELVLDGLAVISKRTREAGLSWEQNVANISRSLRVAFGSRYK